MPNKPSPWGLGKEPGPVKEEHAFALSALPVNSIPFINRLKEVLDEAKTNSLYTFGGHKEGGG